MNININPPPEDRCCNLCGRHVDALNPIITEEELAEYIHSFDDIVANVSDEFLKRFALIQAHSTYTPDRKLYKNYRGVTFDFVVDGELHSETQVEASWECADCIKLPNEEADAILRKSDWIIIPVDQLHPIEDLKKELSEDDQSDDKPTP